MQLPPVTRGELIPARGVMTEPAAQLRAGSYVLQPSIEPEIGLPYATRPEPLDQHAITIAGSNRLICSFELDHHTPCLLDHVRRSVRAPRELRADEMIRAESAHGGPRQ